MCGCHTVHLIHFLTLMTDCVYVCAQREQVQRSEESSPSLRHQSMKPSQSQQSFDSAILDGSLTDENISIDSDFSDNFVVLMDSGVYILPCFQRSNSK